jgi:hypothetical protein
MQDCDNAIFWKSLVAMIDASDRGEQRSEEDREAVSTIFGRVIGTCVDDNRLTLVVPREVSLYDLSRKVDTNSYAFGVLNDLYYCGMYEYCDDYPDRQKLVEEDSKEEGWISVLFQRYTSRLE